MRKGGTIYGKWLQQSSGRIPSHQHVGILWAWDFILYSHCRIYCVVGIFFRWHEKRESAQLRKILFLLLDRNCDFRNHRCYHRRCCSSRCCLLLIFAPEKIKKLRVFMHFAECPQFSYSYFSEAIRLPLHNYALK